jgi:hypothetical protein
MTEPVLPAECVRRPGRPELYGREHYEQVAKVYNWAAGRGLPPTTAVADEFGVPKSTAGKWVARTRKRGLLPPTEQGSATHPTDHYPVKAEIHRATPRHVSWLVCNACLTPWPCAHNDGFDAGENDPCIICGHPSPEHYAWSTECARNDGIDDVRD